MTPARGDIHWVDPGPTRGTEQSGRRPYLVVSPRDFNGLTRTVIAMAVTSRPQRAAYPVTMPLPPGRLPRESWVKIHQVRTISVLRLGGRIASLEREAVDRAVAGLAAILEAPT